jgi:hypothetical protein
MDLLSIRDSKGYFHLPDEQEKLVSQITARDIDAALELILQRTDITLALDANTDEISNPAEKIIFTQLQSSLLEVQESRESIISDINEAFEGAEKKYLSRNET